MFDLAALHCFWEEGSCNRIRQSHSHNIAKHYGFMIKVKKKNNAGVEASVRYQMSLTVYIGFSERFRNKNIVYI